MEINEIAEQVYKAIVQMYEPKLHKIGSGLRGAAAAQMKMSIW